ncbi:hypothetical protein DRW41_18125 [Neobacillus piezotolerans]|uniref:Sodium:proton antiporter n=1 Tax=Neobacillus piezotolerans TaxID=2259171 RepID=A0A3D8GMS5_9BACI|nr:hypothetical protein [Neobacillus piezotolerans]RDU35376.1 hypothetical protein DRW41_18125 [Neobacillus piezotolerans]
MNKTISSAVLFGTAGYLIFKNRYRLMNIVLGTGWVRKVAVRTIMGMPGVKRRMMNSVFGEPNRL